ncbi:MAG: zinc ribbon domain-containing protein, partial [Crocosphaera sp.]
GVKLILVNPAYSSLSCHKCLVIGDRSGKRFTCPNCGKFDADYNGAKKCDSFSLNLELGGRLASVK